MAGEDFHVETLECILTTDCNLACTYCHQGEHRPRSMTWMTLKESIDRLLASEANDRTLALAGGEPLLQWSLARRAIEYAHEMPAGEKCIGVSLVTNGLVLDHEKSDFLAEQDVEIQVSVDGIREAHELRAPGTFDQLNQLLLRLRHDYPSWFRDRLSVGMTLGTANLPFLGRSIKFMLERGVESIRLAPLLTDDRSWGKETEAELEGQMEVVFDLCRDHHRRTGAIPFELFRRSAALPEPNRDRPVCKARSPETLAVGVDGRVSGCPLLLPRESGGTWCAPVLREWVAQAGWPGLRRDRYSSWGLCRDCEIVDECLVCPVASANIPGNTDPRRVPDFNCAFNRIVGRYRGRFPAIAGTEDFLKGTDKVPAAMTDLANALGLR